MPRGEPISLFTVTKCLLVGLTYEDIRMMTGWKKSTIRDHAARLGYKLPRPSEAKFNDDILTRSICEDLASQGFSRRQVQQLMRVPRAVVQANWPKDEPSHAAVACATALLEAGSTPAEVAGKTGLSIGRVLNIAASLKRDTVTP